MEKIAYYVSLQHYLELLHTWEELSLSLQWVGIGFTFLLLERHFTRALAILVSFAAFVTAIAALFTPPTWYLLRATVFSTFIGIGFYYRPILLERYIDPRDKFPAPQDRVLGHAAVCGGEINGFSGSGRIKVRGQLWTALESEGRVINKGDEVLVIGRFGTTLLVEKDKNYHSAGFSRLAELVGKNGIWEQEGHILIDKTPWSAQSWPPGIRIKYGRTVVVVGVKAQTLLVKPEVDVIKEPDDLVGIIGVCKEPIKGLNQPGSVQINDTTWRARADHESTKIATGQFIEVVEMDGMIMLVKDLTPKVN